MRVLRAEPMLFLFPILAAALSAVVLAAGFGLVVVAGVTTSSTADAQTSSFAVTVVGWIIMAVMYLALALITTVSTAALVIGAGERLAGRDATFAGSLGAAMRCAHLLLPWAIVQATVSWLLNALSQRAGIVGVIVSRMLGAAWAIVTFLAVPIIVHEQVGPIQALKRSGTLIKKTWGENVIGQAGIGIVSVLLAFPAIIVLVLGIATTGPTPALGIPLIVVGALALVVVALVSSALTGVYRAALYQYATSGTTPEAFAGVDVANAFTAPTRAR